MSTKAQRLTLSRDALIRQAEALKARILAGDPVPSADLIAFISNGAISLAETRTEENSKIVKDDEIDFF